MACRGMFIDRNSQLRPAGVQSRKEGENIKECFVHEVSAQEAKPFVCKTGPLEYPLPPRRTQIYNGFLTGARECLQPEADLSFMDVLDREFRDTVYDSYWRKRLGRVADPVPNLPVGMVPEEVCFGAPTPKSISAGELVSPQKHYLDVVEESRVGHDMYKRTHNDYDPGEQTERNYVDPFRRDLVWGRTTLSDPQGGCIKKVLESEVDEKVLVSKVLAEYWQRTKPPLGRVFAPHNNLQRVPPGHAFGRPNKRSFFGAAELMKECDPSSDKVDVLEELSSINVVRQQIAKRQPPFPHRDLNAALHSIDPHNSGCLPLESVYETLAVFHVLPDRGPLESLLERLGYLTEERSVCYEKMADLLNVNVMFPDVPKVEDCPRELLNFETTNQAAFRYHSIPGHSTRDIRPAGVPPASYVPVNSLVSPSIFTTYGLSPRDFFVPRSPEFLKTLFRNVAGCEIGEENFRKVWEAAQDRDGCVCVQSFWRTVKELSSSSVDSSAKEKNRP